MTAPWAFAGNQFDNPRGNQVSAIFAGNSSDSTIYKFTAGNYVIDSFDHNFGWDDPYSDLVPR